MHEHTYLVRAVEIRIPDIYKFYGLQYRALGAGREPGVIDRALKRSSSGPSW